MGDRLATITLLVLFSTSLGCGSSDGVAPPPRDDGDANAKPVLTVFAFSPPVITLDPGSRARPTLRAIDQRGVAFPLPGGVTYASNAPEIAGVTADGEVIGVAPGTAEISAETQEGQVAFRATLSVHVLRVLPIADVTIYAGSGGWDPSHVTVPAGAVVQWSTPPINWTRVRNTTLYLLDSTYTLVDSLDLRSGSARRHFPTSGVFRYCSGGCWDPPDFGVVEVTHVP